MASGLDDLLRSAVADRALLFANHVLQSHPLAGERLRPHAGKRVRIVVAGWPLPLLAPPPLTVAITVAGLLEADPSAPGAEATAVDLNLALDASQPLRLLEQMAASEMPAVEIRGDAALAADVSWLLAHVRWDAAADVERFFGPIVASELERSGARLASAAHGAIAGVRGPRGAPAPAMSHLLRLWTIALTFLRLGVVELALSGAPHVGLRWLAGAATLRRRFEMPRGVRLRLALERLGPIFVKFGQVMSTRRDLLPEDIADELARLQDRVPPFAGAQAAAIVEAALRKPLDAVFERFELEPVASASIAQVHFARLRDGREVAVKVLRPGMLAAIDDDLRLLRTFARWLERLSTDAKRLRPRDVVAEFDVYLHDELDLVREAANAAQLRRNMAGLGLVLIPEMIWDLCTSTVIVMERMHGVPIGQLQKLREAGIDFKRLARDGVTIFFTQVFRDGFFHADMHPGNIQVSLAPATFGRYIALDFGIIGTLTEIDKEYLAQNFLAFFRRDYKRVAELHVESGWVPAGTRIDSLEAAVRTVCEPHFDRPLKELSLGTVLLRLFQTSRRFNVEIQPQLVLLQKTLLNIEGLGRQLDPDLDLWITAKPFLERWMNEQIGWRGLVGRLKREAPRYAQLLPQLPRLLHDSLERRPGEAAAPLHVLAEETRRTRRLLHAALALAAVATLVAVAALAVAVRGFGPALP